MKKILLTAAASTILATSSVMAAEGEFYGAVYGGVNMLSNFTTNELKEFYDNAPDIKAKSKTTAQLGLAVGYYYDDMFRADLSYDHLLNAEFKGNGKDFTYGNPVNGTVTNVKGKLKVDVDALMLNGYADFYDAGMAKFYAGLGVGMARVKGKLTLSFTDTPSGGVGTSSNPSDKTKINNNFAYALHLGASTEFAPGMNGFLQYSWKDYGSLNKKLSGGRKLLKSYKLKGHHVSAGLRVDF